MDGLQALAAVIEASPLGNWARASSLAYPVANLLHLLGLVLLVGGIGLLDLRLAGVFTTLPLPSLSRVLTPLALGGLVLMVISGPILFAADATALAQSSTFRWKLSLIALALANAAAFRWLWQSDLERWDIAPPLPGRLMAIASVLLWLGIAALGRLIAYF